MKKKSAAAEYALAENCLFAEIASLQKALVDLREGGAASFEVDASSVSFVDGAGLQLLAAFASEFGKNDEKLVWKNPSKVFRDSVSLLNLDKCILL